MDRIGIVLASEKDVAVANVINVDFIKRRRRINAQILMKAFSEQIMFSTLLEEDCPLFVPILVPCGKRDELRRYLIEHDIYCPIHWPVSKYHVLDKSVEAIYKNELSLVCDQRYTEDDMYRIVNTIKSFWKGNR